MREVLLAVGKSVGLNLAVLAIWYILEYRQFKELQWNRKCDDLVWVIYIVIIAILFYKKG